MDPTQLPTEFRTEIESLLGADAAAFWASSARPHFRALRLNPRAGLDAAAASPELALRFDANDAPARRAAMQHAYEMAADLLERPVPWQEGAYYIADGKAPGTSLMHLLGLYYMQEPSAMSAGAALPVTPGMSVLDMCAAPGGKSSQLAAKLCGRGLLVANEPIPSRAQMLASNIERQGFGNVVVTNEYPDKLAAKWGARFDAILTDAPCSGEGMFRRDETAVREWTPDSPRMCHERQLDILESAYILLKPGGALVYSTCTFNRTENEGTVNEFLRRHTDMATEDFELPALGASRDGMLRIWPHIVDGEGHFVCRLRKRAADQDEISPVKVRKAKPAKQQRNAPREKSGGMSAEKAFAALGSVTALPALDGTPVLFGSRLYLLPENCPPLDGIKVARAGLELAELGRSHIEPAYALARALAPDAYSIALDTADAVHLVRGEQLSHAAPDGYVLTCWRGLPVCFGKAHSGEIKSHFPRGLKPLGNLAEEL